MGIFLRLSTPNLIQLRVVYPRFMACRKYIRPELRPFVRSSDCVQHQLCDLRVDCVSYFVGDLGTVVGKHEHHILTTEAFFNRVNGCGMGPLLVLVYLCFRENVVVTCKIGSFLCNLDNLLQKNVIVFFFENQISKWRSFEKRGYF